MGPILEQHGLELLFTAARSYNRFSAEDLSELKIRSIYELMKCCPTSANCSPGRFVFVRSAEAKRRLADCASSNNKIKIEQAPVTVIIGMDQAFASHLSYLFPHAPHARSWFADPEVAHSTALRNSTLQGAYLIMAARAVGLDCGPMSGFDHALVDREFFNQTTIRSNFICALGRGVPDMLFPRSPRFTFDQVCRFC